MSPVVVGGGDVYIIIFTGRSPYIFDASKLSPGVHTFRARPPIDRRCDRRVGLLFRFIVRQ